MALKYRANICEHSEEHSGRCSRNNDQLLQK